MKQPDVLNVIDKYKETVPVSALGCGVLVATGAELRSTVLRPRGGADSQSGTIDPTVVVDISPLARKVVHLRCHT
jgi:hypothetical protein